MNLVDACKKAFHNLDKQTGEPNVIYNMDNDLMLYGPVSVGWDNVSLYYYHDKDKKYEPTSGQVRSNKWVLYYELNNCPKCKADVDDGINFCSKCGKSLTSERKKIEKKMKDTL